ncbi:hypothetical protein [Demequina maris]|uniref:hypothetical protein n=1 Tax=Demequina maris TaxID=1638982 RepID=UPI0007858A88|nr:hypothetical protein [Demequina maris]
MTEQAQGRPTGTGHVLHIGMHKSATTAIQVAAAAARERLAASGVVYPGEGSHHSDETAYLWTAKRAVADSPAAERRWSAFVADVAATGSRAFISAEHLAAAKPDRIRRIADDLGDDVRVVLTVRNFVSMLPSIWQQYIKERRTVAYEAWLEDVFGPEPGSRTTPNFWPRHDLGELVERWAAVLGPERITVVVLDRAHPERVYRAFETVLDVPEGTLQPQRINAFQANRGLSLEEVELLRRVNLRLSHEDWPAPLYRPAVRGGLVGGLQRLHTPDEAEGVLALPDRWLDTAVAVAEKGVAEALAAGVEVIGDLQEYARRPAPRGDLPTTTREVSPEVLGTAIAGLASRAVAAGVGFHGVKKEKTPTLLAQAPASDALDAALAVPAPGTASLRVLAGADDAAAAIAAGLEPGVAQGLAERLLHRRLAREAGSAATEQSPPLVALSGDAAALVSAGWLDAWTPDEVRRALDALEEPAVVTLELPDLTDAISAAWERAVAFRGAHGLDAWAAWATSPSAWGAWGALPDPAALADVVEVLASHPRVGRERIVLQPAPRTTRRMTALELETLAAAARAWQGRRAETHGIAAVTLLGAMPGLRAARPFEASPSVVPSRLLARYEKARRAAVRRIERLVPPASAELAAAWARQADASPAPLPAEAPTRLAVDQAAAGCLGALSVAMGRGRSFDEGADAGWMGETHGREAGTIDLVMPPIG